MTEQIDKQTLIRNIRARHDELEEIVSSLDEQQMNIPGVNGAWSMKDILAHLVSWQHVSLNRLHAAVNGTEPTVSLDSPLDEINARFYEENKERPLAEIIADFKGSYTEILQAIEMLSEDDLNNPHRYSWWDGEPFWPNIAGNTYGHIDEHIADMRAWLNTHKQNM